MRKLFFFLSSFFLFLFTEPLRAQNTTAHNKSSDLPQDSTQTLEELVVLGTRGAARTITESPVAVDVLDISTMVKDVPQPDLSSMLNYSEPSFTSSVVTGADGTDHIDPAALRGLAPDQTLVLVNGKRRHTSALVNVNGSFGRGSVGTDLNAIPAMAISKVEVLRDGAAAQYGSDAVAGVINIELKKTKGTNVIVTAGANLTTFESYTEAGKGNYQLGIDPKYKRTTVFDGQNYQVGINHGLALGKKGGFLNLTGFFNYRAPTNRAGEPTGIITRSTPSLNFVTSAADLNRDNAFFARQHTTRNDYRVRAGQSELTSGQFFMNASLPVGRHSEIYFFGGMSYRRGSSAAQYRKPGNSQVALGVYPNGFLPLINTNIWDGSFALGYTTKTKSGWNIDISNVAGVNDLGFYVANSENPTAANPLNIAQAGALHIDSTQSSFYAGAVTFIQNTTYVDVVRNFSKILKGLNVAFGATYRYEQYIQRAGETASWANFNRRDSARNPNVVDVNGVNVVPSSFASTDPLVPQGRSYSSAGSQGFTGFTPETALSQGRHNIGVYVDLEQNFTRALLLNLAGRYEYYTDFGHNFSWKAASRLKLGKHVALRAAVSTGFRAPSLPQRYLFKINSVITSGSQEQRGSFPNNSAIARALGVGPLKPEISFNVSAGVTLNFSRFKFTADFYRILIRDRIIYTGTLQGTPETQAILNNFNVNNAVFFTNGLDSRTLGADIVASYKVPVPARHRLTLSLAANWNRSQQVGALHISDALTSQAHRFINPNSLAYLFETIPRYKAFFTLNYHYKRWTLFGRESLFGTAMHVDDNNNSFYRKSLPDGTGRDDESDTRLYVYRQKIGPIWSTDISISYDATNFLRVTLGVNNLFDMYPDVVSGTKGKFYEINTNPNSPNYNHISTHGITAKEMGWVNDDRLTAGLNVGNQFVNSRRVSMLGVNGRYMFVRLLFTF